MADLPSSIAVTVPLPQRPLTIGIDARAATEVPAGRGRLVRELLRALADRRDPHRYILYARTAWDIELDSRFSWRLIGDRDPIWHWRAARDADRDADVFLATNSYLSVLLTRRPSVLVVYDFAALDPATSPNRRSAVVERLTVGTALRRARGLVCISQTTRDELVARVPSAASRTTVGLLAAGPDPGSPTAEEAGGLPPAGFVLAVGTLEPRKNLPRLVAAYARLPAELQRAHPLVVVGAQGWRTGETTAALDSLGERCLRLGYVSDAALAELYRRCTVFCYPSLAEGFGLPVLEAMTYGAPVLTSNVSSLPEVGADAVAYADPLDVQDISRRLDELLADRELRVHLAQQGRIRAAGFSWDDFARAVVAALERAQARLS